MLACTALAFSATQARAEDFVRSNAEDADPTLHRGLRHDRSEPDDDRRADRRSYQWSGTFIHEIGHNFVLRHGSADDVNYKPNHLSVMNYAFQMTGVTHNGAAEFSYQPFRLDALNELSLSETRGLGATLTLRGYRTVWHDSSGQLYDGPAWAAVDWNGDGQINETSVIVDVNGDRKKSALKSTLAEWSALVYTGGVIGSDQSRDEILANAMSEFQKQPFSELTRPESRALKALRR